MENIRNVSNANIITGKKLKWPELSMQWRIAGAKKEHYIE